MHPAWWDCVLVLCRFEIRENRVVGWSWKRKKAAGIALKEKSNLSAVYVIQVELAEKWSFPIEA